MNVSEIIAAHAIWCQKYYGTKTKGEAHRQALIQIHLAQFINELLEVQDFISKHELVSHVIRLSHE